MAEPSQTAAANVDIPDPIDPGPYRQYLHDGESVLLVSRQHLWMLIGRIMQAIVGIAVLIWLSVSITDWHPLNNTAGEWLQWACLAGAGIVLLWCCWHLLVWSRSRMVVTNA
jgi:hypothetical protein